MIQPNSSATADIEVVRPASQWDRIYRHVYASQNQADRAATFDGLMEPGALRWIYGLQYILMPGDGQSRAICATGQYEPNTMLILQDYLKPGGVFIDVGANAGPFTLAAARLVGEAGRVIAYEPSPREARRLIDNVYLNALGQVTIRPLGLSDQEGTAELRLADATSSGLNTLADSFAYVGTKEAGLCPVPLTMLDTEIKQLHLQRLDMMKIDVEGWEIKTLIGARETLRRFKPLLVIEILEAALQRAGGSVGMLEYWLREAGYIFYRISDETAERLKIENLDGLTNENILAVPQGWQL